LAFQKRCIFAKKIAILGAKMVDKKNLTKKSGDLPVRLGQFFVYRLPTTPNTKQDSRIFFGPLVRKQGGPKVGHKLEHCFFSTQLILAKTFLTLKEIPNGMAHFVAKH